MRGFYFEERNDNMARNKFAEIIETFEIDQDSLREIAASVRYDLELALSENDSSSLQIIHTNQNLPQGNECGKFIALDFGGTNLRAAIVELSGNGDYKILRKAQSALRSEKGDFTTADTSCEALFDFIAKVIGDAIEGDKNTPYLLGHTFSFPASPCDENDAELKKWTKEIAVPGVEGKPVNELLAAALKRQGYDNIRPTAVLNDTVAVLLAAAYQNDGIHIGSIYGTGHNSCYAEINSAFAPGKIINLEIGNFYKIFINKYDAIVDGHSTNPDEQRLEKMVSGCYLGELFKAALTDFYPGFSKANFDGEDVSHLALANAAQISLFMHQSDFPLPDDDTISFIQTLAAKILRRSAMIVAASYCGIAWHLYGNSSFKAKIAVEGSLYEKVEQIKSGMAEAFSKILDEGCQIETFLQKDGPLLGAALAACMAQDK